MRSSLLQIADAHLPDLDIEATNALFNGMLINTDAWKLNQGNGMVDNSGNTHGKTFPSTGDLLELMNFVYGIP